MVVLPGEGKVNGAIVLDHAVLAATSLGYGTCWIGAYDASKVKSVLGIPVDHDIVNLVPVGLPADEPKARGRKSPSELFFREQFGVSLDYEPVELVEDAVTGE
jgi:nitroreductase